MRFDFSRFLLEIEQRWRRFRGISFACQLLFYGSLVSIAAVVCLRWALPAMSRMQLLLSLVIPIALAVAAFIIGWWRHPHLPSLLLQLDDSLASGARISSLYEERLRGNDSFFRHRLESLVEALSADWKRGMKPRRRTVGFLSAGLSGILVASVLMVVPLPFQVAVPIESPLESESSVAIMPQSTPVDSTVSSATDGAAPPLESREEISESSGNPQETRSLDANEELSLESVLDDLSGFSRGQTQVDLPTTSEELLDLAQAQEDARQALSDMLEDLMEQMEGQPRPLTQQESQQLQELASQTGDPEVEEQTNDLVNNPDPNQMGEKLQDLMDEMDPDAEQPESAPDTNADTGDGSRRDSPQSTEVSGDEEAGQKFLERTAERLEEQANAESQQEGESQQSLDSGSQDDSQDPSQDGPPQTRMSGDGEDVSQIGGDDGMGGPMGEGPEPGTVGFVHEDAPATVGEEGEFVDEFVTKGVPVEMAPSQSNESTRFVDFERMDSILEDRDLPDEAQASIRRYFELITQPEGGS